MSRRDRDPFFDGLPDGFDAEDDLGEPGEYPFTRGVYRSMYRGRRWTMRQYAGFGTAEATNARYHFLLNRGTTGLSVAFDLPTQMGHDSDAAMAAGEVGRVGVAIDSIADMRTLLNGIDLGAVSCSMTINATAPILLALYTAVADETGVPRDRLRGTVQNDILKEYVARGTHIYPVRPSLRLVSDLMAFCAAELPRWNTISVSGYHIREAGSTAAQEVAFTLANGVEYVRHALARGIELEDFAPRISFFFAAHNDLLEEVAKFRAARRVWSRLMRERFGASDRSCRLRFHTQTGGSTLTAQQPLKHMALTVQALRGRPGGTQSPAHQHYGGARAPGRPGRGARAPHPADPGGGIRRRRLGRPTGRELPGGAPHQPHRGGGARHHGADRGDGRIRRCHRLHAGGDPPRRLPAPAGGGAGPGRVGLNRTDRRFAHEPPPGPDFRDLEARQAAALGEFRSGRDPATVEARVRTIRDTARGGDNLLPPMIAAVGDGVTLGEISRALRAEWGTYDNPR